MFKPATKSQGRGRVALIGPSGSGKTYTGLILATTLADGGKVAVIDTERGSASKYADLFQFDVCELHSFAPAEYVKAIKAAESAGYVALLIDSLSHAWMGTDGALEQVDRAAARSRSGNSFAAWREVTPMHNALIDAMLQSSCHIIATMRSKTEYVLEDDGKGKKVPRKIGMAPVQRDGMEYEFDVTADLDWDHHMIVSKTRCPALDKAVIATPDAEVGKLLLAWLGSGEPMPNPFRDQQQQRGKKKPAAQATAQDRILATTQPRDLLDLIRAMREKHPVADNVEKWKAYYKLAGVQMDEKKWGGQDADALHEELASIADALDLAEQGAEAFQQT